MANVSRQVRRAQERAAWRARKSQPPPRPPLSPSLKGWINGLLAVGATGLSVTIIVGSFGPAGLLNMATAYAMLAAAWVIATLAIAFSEWIWDVPSKHKVVAGGLLSVAIGLGLLWLGRYEYEANFELTHLVADDLPTPKEPTCGPHRPEATLVFFGDSSVVETALDGTILKMGRDREGAPLPMFKIRRDSRGISISLLRIYGEDGKISTVIDSDSPWINSNFRSQKIDPHHLIVFDEKDQKTLDLHYLNDHAIKLTGIFRRPNMAPVVISNSMVTLPKVTIAKDVCMTLGEGSTAIFVDGPRL